MKKTLSIILTLCMVLGLCSFSVAAAPEGTAITDAAGFAAMDPAGTYYLANDITISESYAQVFTGTFDGNGKTVTVSAPMFANFAGTAKNFTIAGEVSSAEALAIGAFAGTSVGGTAVVLENIVNNANVTASAAEAVAGGILGQLGVNKEANGVPLTVTNCVNNGTVSATAQAGGLVGVTYSNSGNSLETDAGVTFTNCVNNGKVTGGQHTAGIIGRVIYTKNCNVTGCVNNADILGGHNSGGIIGHTTSSILFMTRCQNNGNIANTEGITATSVYAGGLVGYAQGTKNAEFSAANGQYANKIEFCINTGNVLAANRAGGIVASTGTTDAQGLSYFNYCINTGDVATMGVGTKTSHNCVGGILGYGYGDANQYAHLFNCISTGNISSTGKANTAAYFLGYINSENATVANCSALGTLTSEGGATYSIGWNNKKNFTDASTGNSVPANCPYPVAYESQATSTRDFALGTTDEAALASGEVIYAINQAAGAEVFFMTAGSFAPTVVAAEDGSNSIVKNADGTYGNPVKEPETTEAPETTEPAPETTEPSQGPATGDSFVIFAVIAAVAVLGVAVVAKRREN